MKYRWKLGSHVKGVTAQDAGERLEQLRNAFKGRLRPVDVLADARQAESPLHTAFEWDDTAAAEQYRLEQAGQLIRSVHVIYDETTQKGPVRAFVHVLQSGDEDRTFTSIAHAMQTPDLREQVIARAMAEVKAWRKRYKDYEELASIFDAIDDAKLQAA